MSKPCATAVAEQSWASSSARSPQRARAAGSRSSRPIAWASADARPAGTIRPLL
ncbi:MAG: hypothetical protein HC914_17340 [Chloroflexaceae bacterium]|nr:hypothetical protein [Chloroflexaceae bacterium]